MKVHFHIYAQQKKESDKQYKKQASTFSVGKIKIDNNQPVHGVVASYKAMLKCKPLFSHLCTAENFNKKDRNYKSPSIKLKINRRAGAGFL